MEAIPGSITSKEIKRVGTSDYVDIHVQVNEPKDARLGYLAYLEAETPLEHVAQDSASTYKARLNADYVAVTINDQKGCMRADAEAGTPAGMHWVQDGIEWENGPFGPVNVYPHWGLHKD